MYVSLYSKQSLADLTKVSQNLRNCRETAHGGISVKGTVELTAEMAILNRTAVALAADSVVTLSSQSGRKTYDSAEKIFELSRWQPIGLMIYNNAQHLNAPLEVVVRNFREGLTETATFDRLEGVWSSFSEFLINFPHTEADRLDHLRRMVAVELDKLSIIYFNFMFETVVGKRRPRGERSIDRVRFAIAERRAEAEAMSIDGLNRPGIVGGSNS